MTPKDPHQIVGYIVLEADMEAESPLRIGSGKDDRADIEVVRWPRNGDPYVPASGLVGALAHRFRREVDDPSLARAGKIFWGSDKEDTRKGSTEIYQSHLRVQDMDLKLPDEGGVQVRDGVRINSESNTAEDNMKFDYEVVDRGATFTVKAEITLRAGFWPDEQVALTKLVSYLRNALEDDLRIGSGTTRGFGKLKCNEMRIHHFDFTLEDPEKAKWPRRQWFGYLSGAWALPKQGGWDQLPEPNKDNKLLSIETDFHLKNSMVIGSAGDEVDKVHLKSLKKPVISGTSLAGALRHRTRKILNTIVLQPEEVSPLVENLFGMVYDDNLEEENQRARKSRILTEESIVEQSNERVQTRIRVSSFSGGVIRGGLFSAKALRQEDGQKVTLGFKLVDPEDWEVVLLLHLLKDLWNEDLPIGGEKSIGRGRLTGQESRITWDQHVIVLKANGDQLDIVASEEAKEQLARAQQAYCEKFKLEES